MIINAHNIASLGKTYNAAFQDGFGQVAPQWSTYASLVQSMTEAELYAFLLDFPGMREWVGDRVVRQMKIGNYTVFNKLFEATESVPEQKIKDDLYGVYGLRFKLMGEAVARHPDEIVSELMASAASESCADGQNFLDTDHPVLESGIETSKSNYDATGGGPLWMLLDTSRVLKPFIYQQREKVQWTALDKPDSPNVFNRNEYLYGAKCRDAAAFGFWQMAYGSLNTLNATNVDTYVRAMRSLKSDHGKPLNVSPTICVVGPSNEAAAEELFLKPLVNGGETNRHYNKCKVVVNPYLP